MFVPELKFIQMNAIRNKVQLIGMRFLSVEEMVLGFVEFAPKSCD